MSTYLRPNHLCQGSYELRGGIDAKVQGFFIDNLANVVPQSRLEALMILSVVGRFTAATCKRTSHSASSSFSAMTMMNRLSRIYRRDPLVTLQCALMSLNWVTRISEKIASRRPILTTTNKYLLERIAAALKSTKLIPTYHLSNSIVESRLLSSIGGAHRNPPWIG